MHVDSSIVSTSAVSVWPERRRPTLRGRQRESDTLDQLLSDVRSGLGRALVLRGDAGIGKTTLLDQLCDRARGFRLARVSGVESELELPFAGLHQLCAPMLDRLDRLPVPQRDALGTAFGLGSAAAPDRFLVGLAVLSLLADAAEHRPLLCVVDDAQWLDDASAQVLAFVARRLLAEPIAVVFATRPVDDDALRGLPDHAVRGLDDAAARELMLAALPRPLDAEILGQIIAESRGNPLALLELPRSWAVAEGAVWLAPAELPTADRVQQGFATRLRQLPDTTRLLLLVAAAEPLGDPVLLWRAAEALGTGIDAAAPAEAAGFIEFGVRVWFRHPLVRSTAYWSASPQDRRRAHAALAQATDPVIDPDRRAWHRAQAAPSADEDVAAELERSAGRAQARGGLAAAAAFLEQAAKLTPHPARRATRALAAAAAKHQAGAMGDAAALLAVAQAGPIGPLEQARVELVRGQLAFSSSHGRDAPALLLAAARQFEPLDADLSRDTYLEALAAGLFVGRLAGQVGAPELAAAARTLPAAGAPRLPDLLLDGLARVIADGYESGAPDLRRAITAFRAEDIPRPETARWLWLATHAAHDLWDDESWDVLSARHIRVARRAGALAILPIALSMRIGFLLFAGELADAASMLDEIAMVTDATGNRLPPYGAVALAAWQGRESDAATLIGPAVEDATRRGEGLGLTLVRHAQAVLYNGLGRYDEALRAAEQAAEYPAELAFATWSLVQLIEAAARTGQADRATAALRRLVTTTRASGTHWALGVEARSRALLATGAAAESLYREAIDLLARTRLRMELARARLLYGEWLRREGRRADARDQLRLAHTALFAMGAQAFADRARSELLATGETVRATAPQATVELSPQEAQIARLAAGGSTNAEIGAELFLSPRTVEWHLRKIFIKLGVTSRKQLRTVLPDATAVGAPG